MQWLLKDLDALDDRRGGPVAWIVQTGSEVADGLFTRVRPSRGDLADAARAREDGGAGRLFRRLMLRALAARVTGQPAEDVEVERCPSGAILLPRLSTYASASGSGTYHLVALAHAPIGADIEIENDLGDMLEWTAREAYLKALTIGLDGSPDDVMLHKRGGNFVAQMDDCPCGYIRRFIGRGYSASLAELGWNGDSSYTERRVGNPWRKPIG